MTKKPTVNRILKKQMMAIIKGNIAVVNDQGVNTYTQQNPRAALYLAPLDESRQHLPVLPAVS